MRILKLIHSDENTKKSPKLHLGPQGLGRIYPKNLIYIIVLVISFSSVHYTALVELSSSGTLQPALRKNINGTRMVNTIEGQIEANKDQTQIENVVQNIGEEAKKSNLRYRFTIVHCREPIEQIQWIHTLPSNWDIIVYETCGQNVSNYSRPFQNAGSEECTAYLTTMVEDHDDPYDVSAFVQSDVLLGSGRVKLLYAEHSPFWTSAQVVSTVEKWAEKKDGSGLLMFGPQMLTIENINDSDIPYLGSYPREVFDTMGLSYTKNSTRIDTRSGACFAVRKERIHSLDKQKLITLKDRIFDLPKDNVRKMCCGLENTWHAVLGEDCELPKHSTVDHLWIPIVQKTKGQWAGKLMNNYTSKEDLEKYIWHYRNSR
ncbi:hypothetical protein CTEN210_10215 [Chaetoceros tenuissimus]|uniref:Uncharacterized protein n=1 Tax=Chaetoceros tenuissimus TaxID=426638 RepID=A0AAD3CXI1_9STRA|nr:hypothetical protein CTEN210_10215 [Chaetoceros tenuissimus]